MPQIREIPIICKATPALGGVKMVSEPTNKAKESKTVYKLRFKINENEFALTLYFRIRISVQKKQAYASPTKRYNFDGINYWYNTRCSQGAKVSKSFPFNVMLLPENNSV